MQIADDKHRPVLTNRSTRSQRQEPIGQPS
jgi:hypothetical protein